MTQTGLPQFDGLPISVVERETGIPKDLLRMWERRYGFPEPARDAQGDRVYPREQVDKLLRQIARGHLSLKPARAALDHIVAADHPYSRKVALSGWALMAAAVTLMLGGSPTLAVVSGLHEIIADDGRVRAHLKMLAARMARELPARIDALPELPTMKEAGVADFESVLVYGLIAPRGLPAALQAEIDAMLARRALQSGGADGPPRG